MNSSYKKNKNALLLLGSYLLIDVFDWHDHNIEPEILSYICLDHLKSFFSKEDSFLSKGREEYLHQHASRMFSKKLSLITPKFENSEDGISSVVYSNKAKKLSEDKENFLINLGFLYLIHDETTSAESDLKDISELLQSIDKVLSTKHMRAYIDTYMNEIVKYEKSWQSTIYLKICPIEEFIKILLKDVKRELEKISFNILNSPLGTQGETIICLEKKRDSILKSLNIMCKRLCEKSFIKKESMALSLLEVDIDFVELGFETDPSFIDSIKEYIKSEDQNPIRKAKFYSYFSKEDFLSVIEKGRKNKNRDVMVDLIKMSSKIGFIDKKQARYIRSETSDKRAKIMVRSLMKNFSKVSDKQTVLAMLSDIRHRETYLTLIERVPKNFLFMFVGNPLRKDYRAKEILERRMTQ